MKLSRSLGTTLFCCTLTTGGREYLCCLPLAVPRLWVTCLSPPQVRTPLQRRGVHLGSTGAVLQVSKADTDAYILKTDERLFIGRYRCHFSTDPPRIRRSTWLRLLLLSRPRHALSDVMRASLSQDPLHHVAPLLSEPHLAALDRRLKTVLETVRRCRQRRREESGGDDVIFDDAAHLKDALTPAD